MQLKIRSIFFTSFLLLWQLFLMPGGLSAASLSRSVDDDFVPGPVLLSPTADNVAIPIDGSVVFKWERRDIPQTRSYIFKLYKGYKAQEATLLIKKDIPARQYPFSLSAKDFQDTCSYTWVLVQVFHDGKKSDKSAASFKVNLIK